MASISLISVEGFARRFPGPGGTGEAIVFEDIWFDIEPGEVEPALAIRHAAPPPRERPSCNTGIS